MLNEYPKTIVTRDGTSIQFRLAGINDAAALSAFFTAIPEQEQCFLRENLGQPSLLISWLSSIDYDKTLPIIAVVEDTGEIIGNLRCYRSTSPAMMHVAHIRIMVTPEYREQRVGSWMLLDIIKLAMSLGIEKIIGEFIAGIEDAALNAAYKLDFHKEAVLEKYVKDMDGIDHDLVIVVRNLYKEWSDF